MKKYLVLATLIILSFQVSFAQRFGYIDSEIILNKMPEYKSAQKELSSITSQWQTELKAKQQVTINMRQQLEAEKVLLTDDLFSQKEKSILVKEKELQDYQAKVFGYDGLLFKKRQELIQPVQDKMFDAVRAVCKKKKLHIMFDKAADLHMLYTDNTYNFTDFVLEQLGLGDPKDKGGK